MSQACNDGLVNLARSQVRVRDMVCRNGDVAVDIEVVTWVGGNLMMVNYSLASVYRSLLA